MDYIPHDQNDLIPVPKPKRRRREKVDDLWDRCMMESDIDGLIRLLVYDPRLFGRVPEYKAKIIGLVETLAANDVDELIAKIYQQNLTAVSRWMLQARIKMESLRRDRARGITPDSPEVANTLQQHTQEWELAMDQFNMLAQKYMGVRDSLKRKPRAKDNPHEKTVDGRLPHAE